MSGARSVTPVTDGAHPALYVVCVHLTSRSVTMTKNMGSLDRVIRVAVALLIVVLYLTGQISGLAAVILGILALVFILTSTVGFCPLYAPFRFSTRRRTA